MIHIKNKVNKSTTMRELHSIALKRYEYSYDPIEHIEAFMDGAEQLFKLLRIDAVITCGLCGATTERRVKIVEHGYKHCSNCGNHWL